ncbi:MAG: DUF3164 family protein [Desulfovibrionaceae bacterium]
MEEVKKVKMEPVPSPIIEVDGKEYMSDTKGRMVPIALVSEVDRARDGLVRELVGKFMARSEDLAEFKLLAMGDINAFVALVAEKYDAKIGGAKGNVSLVSFDGKYRVQLAKSDVIAFGEELQAAKALVDECLSEWSANAPEALRAIVADAFDVDKEGTINTARVLSLRKFQVDDPRWQKAMEAIKDAIRIISSATYLRAYRMGDDNQWHAIPLDIAAL